MADTFKGIITADGKKRQLTYSNVLETPSSDATLSVDGGFADAKTVGDKFAKVDKETNSLKEDLDDLKLSAYLYKRSDAVELGTGETWLLEENNMYSIETIPKNTFIRGIYVKATEKGKIKIDISVCREISGTNGEATRVYTKTADVVASDYNYIPINTAFTQSDTVVFIGYIDRNESALLPQKEASTLQELKQYILTDNKTINYNTGKDKYGLIADIVIETSYINKISVKQFGCIGDGTHDDTECFQKAINFATRNNITLNVENGVYLITKTLNVENNIKIVGESFCPTYGLWHETFTHPILVVDENTFVGGEVIKFRNSRTTIKNLYILNKTLTSTNKHIPKINGLTLTKGVSFINNLGVCGFKYGVMSEAQSISNFNNMYISACIVCIYNYYTSDSLYNNIYLNTNHFMLDYIEYNSSLISPSVVGMAMLGGNNTITNGKIEYLGTGLLVGGSVNIAGFNFDSCYKNSINVKENSENYYYVVNISNNIFLGGHSGSEHITLSKKMLSCNIDGNVFSKSSGDALPYSGDYPDTVVSTYMDNKNTTSVVLFTNNIAHKGSASRTYNLTNCYKFISKNNTITPFDNSYIYETDLIEDGNIDL